MSASDARLPGRHTQPQGSNETRSADTTTVPERDQLVERSVLPINAGDVRPRDLCRIVLGDHQSRHGRRTSGRKALQTGVKRGGHAHSVRLGQLRPFAGEERIDGGAPQPQPPLEMTGSEPDPRVQFGVWAKRSAAVGATPKQDRLPKRRDPWHVRFEIELGDVDKDPADHRITHRTPVERTHEPLAIIAILDIAIRPTHAHAHMVAHEGRGAKPLGSFGTRSRLSCTYLNGFPGIDENSTPTPVSAWITG
jgi:hypothetical protein